MLHTLQEDLICFDDKFIKCAPAWKITTLLVTDIPCDI